MQLKDKVAFITGAANGLGKAIAKLFLSEGAKVIIADLQADAAEKTRKELDPSLKNTLAVGVDVSSKEQVEQAFAKAEETFPKIHILVSNAGIQIVDPIEKYDFQNWKKMQGVHLDGAFLTTQMAYRNMMKHQEGGAILLMGSAHSKVASPLKSAYVSAKHALLGLARTVAKEGAVHKIKANVICPGFVLTDLVAKQIPLQAKELGISEDEVVKKVLLGGTVDGAFTTAEDVAKVFLFFAAFESLALTGQSLIVSHGWCME